MLQVNQNTSALLEADLVDESELPVDGDALDSATLTLTSAEDDSVINSRNAVDILSFIDADGHLAFALTPDDTVLLDDRKPSEWRNATIVILWNGGDKGLTHVVRFSVKRVLTP